MSSKQVRFRHFAIILIIALSLVGSSWPFSANAQIGVNVYKEVIYKYLDKLASRKLIRTYSPNQRPLSRYSVAKMVIEARDRFGHETEGFTEKIISELETEFEKEIDLIRNHRKNIVDFRPLKRVTLSWIGTDQPEEAMPNNGLGPTSGRVQPLLAYKEGRHYNNYANFYFETTHWLQLTPYFAAYLQPQFFSDSSSDPKGGAKIHYGYLKAGYKNFEFQIGRDQLRWGPGLYGGLFFTNDARGQDMIRLTNPSTFRLPWVLRYLGQWRFTAFFSWLGTKYHPPNPILSGYRLDYNPLFWWDIGFDHAVIMGGKGAKDPSVATAIGEYIGFIFDSGNARATSNHLIGFDMTVRIPPLLGVELYGKVLFEDTNKEAKLMYLNNASWLGGIHFPRVDPSGRLSLRGEFVHTGEFAYRHGFYADGFALDGKFIGYDAGSDTYSGILNADYIFNMDEFIDIQFRYLWRSSNVYQSVYDATGNHTSIVVARAGPKENHIIFKIGGQKRLSKIVNVYGELGLDYTRNKFFTQGRNALDFAAQVGFIFHNL